MAIVQMSKIALIGLADDKNRILSKLMKLGAIEINDIEIDEQYENLFEKKIEEAEITDIDSKINKSNRSLSIIAKHDQRKKPMFKVRTDLSMHDYRHVVLKRHDVLHECDKIIKLNEEIISFKNDINRNQNSILSLNPWNKLDIEINYTGTKRLSVCKGTFPSIANMNAIIEGIEEQQLLCNINIINEDAEQYYTTIYMYKENEKEILQYLKRNGLSVINFSNYTKTVDDNIVNLDNSIIELENQILQKENKLIEYASLLDEIEIVFDYYSVRKDLELVNNDIAKSKRTFLLEGWIATEKTVETIKVLEENWILDVSIREPYEEEEFPVLLKNGFIGDATEGITAMYSLPNCREADPNPIMAPFFMLFFGLMLSDAGYGLVMALACGFIYYKVKLEDSTKKFIKLMMLSGVATIFWGALFGSWFGNFIPILLGDSTRDISLWFDPVRDPEFLLMWSLFFGVIHVFVGLAMRGYNLIKRKKYIDILFDVIFWYIFFVGAVFIVMPMVPGVPMDTANLLSPYGSILLPIGAILLFVTQGRAKKGIIGKLIGGLSSLYDLVGFMSDVLSYSRLLAMGLATSVIATIVNDMGAMGGFNIVGIIVFTLVFVAGHAFNFALNALGAYVHSSRLQYIEFFSKFYKGEGKAFSPFKRNTKYVRIKN